MTDLFWMMLCLMGFWGLGCSIALSIAGSRLLLPRAQGRGNLIARAELIGLGLVLGIAATSYLQFVWSFAGGLLGRSCSVTLAVGGIILGLVGFWRTSGSPAMQDTQLDRGTSPMPAAGSEVRFARVCLIAILGLIVVAFIQTFLSPQKFWDERAYYGLKAIVLFQDHSIHSPDLAHPDFVQGHPRYPLLIPLAEQHVYALLGRVDDRLSKIIFPLMFTGMVFTFAGVLMRHLRIGTAWLGALLLATTPVLMPDDYGFLTGQADAPVSCFEGLALLYLWDSVATSRAETKSIWYQGLIFGAIFGAMVAFTKDEGISHGLIRTTAFGCALIVRVLMRRSPNDSVPDAGRSLSVRDMLIAGLILVAVPALLLAPWFLHRRHLPLTGEMNYFGRLTFSSMWNGLPTLRWSVPHLIERMFTEAPLWGLQWLLVAVTLILFPSRAWRPAQLFLLSALTVDIAALLLAGMIAPITLEEHIGGSSHRYLMQLAPGAVLFAIGQIWYRENRPDTA